MKYTEEQKMLLLIVLIFSYVKENISQNTRMNPKTVDVENWTTCEQFLNNTSFNKSSVIDREWKIFFFWNYVIEDSYVLKFRLPSSGLVKKFSDELDEELFPSVNWTHADLFMETPVDFSALMIRTDTHGQYRLITSASFIYANVPTPVFGIKVVEPGILGIMNCKWRLCYALAPVDSMPPDDKLEETAKKLGFWGQMNRSYIDRSHIDPLPIDDLPFNSFDEPNVDDDEEDEEFEIAHQANRVQML